MNTPDNFEQRLLGRRPKHIPAEWREEILSAAYSERAEMIAASPAHRSRWSLKQVNYAALATAWIIIAGLYSSNHLTSPERHLAKQASSPSISEEFLREQRQMLAELLEPSPPQPQPHAKPAPALVPRRSGNRVGSATHVQIV